MPRDDQQPGHLGPGEAAGDDMARQLSELAATLDRHESEAQVLRTLYALAHTLDYGDHAGWVNCFTQDAVFEMVDVVGAKRTVRVRHAGRTKLAEFIPGHTHAPEHYHKHLVANPQVKVLGEQAECESYMVRLDRGDTGPFLWSFGRYVDTFVACPDGRWRVSHRVIEAESRAQPVRASDIGAARLSDGQGE